MPKTKEQKKEILKNLQNKIKDSKAVVFSSDSGLDVKTVQDLRRDLKKTDSEYLVTKKTLLKIATKGMEEAEQLDELKSSVAVTFSYNDEASGAKTLNKFAKANELLELGGGILEGKFILPDMVKRLASLPSKEQLLANLVSTLANPMQGIVGVLSGTTRSFVNVLNAIKENKE